METDGPRAGLLDQMERETVIREDRQRQWDLADLVEGEVVLSRLAEAIKRREALQW